MTNAKYTGTLPLLMNSHLTTDASKREVVATLSSKGQVTLPAAVREHLCVGRGDQIAFVSEDDGVVRLSVPSYPTIDSLRGAAGTLKKPLSWHDVRDIACADHLDHAPEP